MRRKEKWPKGPDRNRTGCHVCKRKHNKNKIHVVRVQLPDREGTVHVCAFQAKRRGLTVV
jgi:hypothetical protein